MNLLARAPLHNYINGQGQPARSPEVLDVCNPATVEVLNRVPLSAREDAGAAVQAAADAYRDWRRVSVTQRI